MQSWRGSALRFARPASFAPARLSRSFATAGPNPPKRGKWARRTLILGSAGVAAYLYDTTFNASAFTRTLRSFGTVGLIALDYKLNFNAESDIDALHNRNAERLFSLLVTNKGLYIKSGQALALQATAFPPVYQQKFMTLFDNAPQDTREQIQKTFYEEFGVTTDEVFASFDVDCIASASVAQVHKAQLKTGEWVAVKVQHADIQKQVYWDLETYKTLMTFLGWFFELPLREISTFVASRMETETDFISELNNGETARKSLETSSLKDVVYIPQNYSGLSTKRVLVSEWIDGVPFGKKDLVVSSGFSPKWALRTINEFFAFQIFEWGAVHCDPHPGNILLRKFKGRDQVVLLDHGLYAMESPQFREKNGLLWKSLFILDRPKVREVIEGWGIGAVDMFASMTIMKPYDSSGAPVEEKTDFELQQEMLETFKTVIKDINQMPLVITLIGRCLNLLQGINRMYGSPVNRIKIFAHQASKSYSELHAEQDLSVSWPRRKLRAWLDHVRFQLAVFLMDAAFVVVRVRQILSGASRQVEMGMEAVLERQMQRSAESMGFKMSSPRLVLEEEE